MVQTYQAIFARAAERHGSAKALEAKLAESRPKSPAELAALPDDRWLAEMTRRIFQAGFNWSVIDNKWDGFEAAFEGFDVGRWAMAGDDDLDRLARDTRIVRNPQKIRTVRENAFFCPIWRRSTVRRRGSSPIIPSPIRLALWMF